jgi:hypothetical protein
MPSMKYWASCKTPSRLLIKTLCVWHYYLQANTNSINKIWALLQTNRTSLKLNLSKVFGEVSVFILLVLCVALCFFVLFVFVLYLVCPMLPVSLHCPFLIAPSVFSNVYLSYVLCTQCWQCFWIVHCWLPIQFSLMFISPVSCVLNVDRTSGVPRG